MKTACTIAAALWLAACSIPTPNSESPQPLAPEPQRPLSLGDGVELVAEVRGPRGIVVGGGRVYVTSFMDHGIFSAAVGGGSASKVAEAAWPTYVALDATHVYWTDLGTPTSSGSVGRVALSGGSPQLLATDLFHPNSTTLIGGDVCFARYVTPGSASVECVPRGGGARDIIGAQMHSMSYVATNGTQVCWTRGTNGGSIACRARAGGATVEIARDQSASGHVAMLAIDSHEAFWVQDRGGAIHRTPLVGGVVIEVAPAGTGDTITYDLAVDATHVYWFAMHGPTAAIRKVPKTGGAVTDLAAEADHPMGITVDATHVYWTAMPRWVKRVAK